MQTFCGYVAIVGRPNVGKSTLLNKILGQKISITSRKAQTTRHTIIGVKTESPYQAIYIDTPGFHQANDKALNRVMNKSVITTMRDVDSIVFVVDSYKWTDEDQLVLSKLKQVKRPVIAVINKVDKLSDKGALLPVIEQLQQAHDFEHIVPVSAKSGENVDVLEKLIFDDLPKSPYFYDESQLTDKSTRFIVAEIVREKIFRLCGQELPYSVSVEIEQYKQEQGLIKIGALIWVDKESHKRMIIGKGGAKLKQIGSAARIDIEKVVESKVHLTTWIKVKTGWADDDRALRQLGYE